MTDEFILETDDSGKIHPTALWAVINSPRYDAVHKQLAKELDEMRKAFGHFACQVMAVAISGLADAAIVSNQPMNEQHALAAVEQLAKHARELRERTQRLEK